MLIGGISATCLSDFWSSNPAIDFTSMYVQMLSSVTFTWWPEVGVILDTEGLEFYLTV